MENLPVREMVLYKHGVGFFVREGKFEGDSLTLNFREDDINDILKSLTIFDRAGGQVLGIDYQTPMDREQRLASSSIKLGDLGSLRDLLRDLRGRRVTLEVTNESLTGRLIGLDEQKTEREDFTSVSVLDDQGQVQILDLFRLRGVQIHDAQSAQDLSYFLDTSMREDVRRAVTVRLTPGEHDLVVSYVAPSPTWRVSYRVVAESDEGGATGKLLLQGWGLFDNRLEEDLENVRVTLVAGQPISFIYDLYESRIPQRQTIKDEARISPGAVEYEGYLAASIEPREGVEGMYGGSAAPQQDDRVAGMISDSSPRFFQKASRQRMDASVVTAAEGREAGELFQYVVNVPVTVKRGASALVLIISSEINYRRELLYNKNKLPNHPVAALRFENTTGLTLERGPVTLVEDGDYKGEAILSFCKEAQEVYLPYAVELGVGITYDFKHLSVKVGFSFQDEYLIQDLYHVVEYQYVLHNTTLKPMEIVIEADIYLRGGALWETPLPETETAKVRRWRVPVASHTLVEFTTKERDRGEHRSELRKLKYQQLQEYFQNKWLDKKTFDELSDFLGQLAAIERLKAEADELNAEREQIYKQQKELRENLKSLQAGSSEETALRGRMLGKLETTQNNLEALEAREKAVAQEIAAAEKQVEQIIAGLGQGNKGQSANQD